jgi:hypothetical protein
LQLKKLAENMKIRMNDIPVSGKNREGNPEREKMTEFVVGTRPSQFQTDGVRRKK